TRDWSADVCSSDLGKRRRRFDGHPGSVTRRSRSVIASRRKPMAAESRLKEKNITLPTPNTPVANYVGAVRAGNLLFVSGHGPLRTDGKPAVRGKVGRELSVEQGDRKSTRLNS